MAAEGELGAREAGGASDDGRAQHRVADTTLDHFRTALGSTEYVSDTQCGCLAVLESARVEAMLYQRKSHSAHENDSRFGDGPDGLLPTARTSSMSYYGGKRGASSVQAAVAAVLLLLVSVGARCAIPGSKIILPDMCGTIGVYAVSFVDL